MSLRTASIANCTVYATIGPQVAQNDWTRNGQTNASQDSQRSGLYGIRYSWATSGAERLREEMAKQMLFRRQAERIVRYTLQLGHSWRRTTVQGNGQTNAPEDSQRSGLYGIRYSWATSRAQRLHEEMPKQMLLRPASGANCTVYATVGPQVAQNDCTRKCQTRCSSGQPGERIVRYTLQLGHMWRITTGRGDSQTDASQDSRRCRLYGIR
jgi:hypothetical protein